MIQLKNESMIITILLGSNELTRSIKLSFTSELMYTIILTIISELTGTIKLIPIIESMRITTLPWLK